MNNKEKDENTLKLFDQETVDKLLGSFEELFSEKDLNTEETTAVEKTVDKMRNGQIVNKMLKQKPLCQDEVDAILRALGLEKEDVKDYGSVESVNIDGEHNWLLFGRAYRLEIICDRFARYVSDSLSKLCGIRIEVNPICIDNCTFGQVMRSLPVPHGIGIFESNVISTGFLNNLDARCVFALVESVFGGISHQPKIEGREFTEIEQAVLDRIQKEIGKDFVKAWSEFIANMDVTYSRHEFNPQFAGIVDPSDPCFVITYEVEMDTSLGTIIQIIPILGIKQYYELMTLRTNVKVLNCSDEEYVNIISKRNNEKKIIPTSFDSNSMNFINKIPPQVLAMKLREEHPQTIACLLSFAEPLYAAECICHFPAGVRSEIIFRMESLDFRTFEFINIMKNTLYNMVFPSVLKKEKKGQLVMDALSHINTETYKEIKDEILEENSQFFKN